MNELTAAEIELINEALYNYREEYEMRETDDYMELEEMVQSILDKLSE